LLPAVLVGPWLVIPFGGGARPLALDARTQRRRAAGAPPRTRRAAARDAARPSSREAGTPRAERPGR
jgi:hypothetical protein